MAKGLYYSARENAILINLIVDFPNAKNSELAEIAIRYGGFPNRTANALAQQIRRLKAASSSEVDTNDQVEFDFSSSKYDALEAKYESLISVIIGEAGLYNPYPYHYGLSLDIPAIMEWIYKNEPDRVGAKLDSLIAESNEQ